MRTSEFHCGIDDVVVIAPIDFQRKMCDLIHSAAAAWTRIATNIIDIPEIEHREFPSSLRV